MTIDEAIIQSRIQLTICEEGCTSKLDNSPKAVETLIEIARKYQKIEQIVKVWHQDIYAKDFECMAEIAEVVEDENVTN